MSGERVFVERISSTAELPLSEESKKILAYASHEAESMLHSTVGSEHLLIEILTSEEEHVDWLEAQLELVKQVGEGNYLAQQIRI